LVEENGTSVVDVVSSDGDSINVDLEDGASRQANLESHGNHALSAAYLVKPGMLAMQDAYPGIVQHWAKHGMDMVVAADKHLISSLSSQNGRTFTILFI
jgi:hypothetical protein